MIIALLGPRIAIAILAIFTSFFERAFDGLLLPLLGFVFLPFTTLAYAWAINTRGEVAGLQAVLLVLAVLLDVSAFGRGEVERRRRSAS